MSDTEIYDGSEPIVDLEAIGEQYEEKGYFRRLKEMFAGLGKAHDTREYKLARTELQRQAAPLVAFVSVVLFVVVLIVVTAITGGDEEEYKVEIQQPEPEPEVETQQEEEPPPDDPEPTPIDEVDIQIDNPTPGPPIDSTPMPAPPTTQVSAKPAEMNSVAFVNSPVKMNSIAGNRNPGQIGRFTSGGKGYGDNNTEAAVLKVLWYLKTHQNSDGSWVSREGTQRCKPAATGLAILTYLAHGEYPGSDSRYRRDFGGAVERGLQYLIGSLSGEGKNLRFAGEDGNEYAFLIATYALSEAFAMTDNPECKAAAQRCLERIIAGQSPTGGWDYKLNSESTRDDLSFAGWALQALKAGKLAKIHPDGLDECIKKAISCLKKRNFKSGGFGYTAGGSPSGLTATGCLAMQLLGFGSHKEVSEALNYMRGWMPAFEPAELNPDGNSPGPNPQYYAYYATQCKYQAGMKAGANKTDEKTWQDWNSAMKKLYTTSIRDLPEPAKDYTGKDHKQGYYSCIKDHYSGDIMSSCLVALQLMVYYRYLPTNQLKAAEEEKPKDAAAEAADAGDVSVTVDI